MALLTKDQILTAKDSRTIKVDVPEWGGEVLLRTLSLETQFAHEKIAKDGITDELVIETLIASIIDEDGNRLFIKDDLKALNDKNPQVLLRLYKECLDLHTVKEGDIGDIAKNS